MAHFSRKRFVLATSLSLLLWFGWGPLYRWVKLELMTHGAVHVNLYVADIWVRPNLAVGDELLSTLYALTGPMRGLSDEDLEAGNVQKLR